MTSVTPVTKLCIVAKFKGFCRSVDFELVKRKIILDGSKSEEKALGALERFSCWL